MATTSPTPREKQARFSQQHVNSFAAVPDLIVAGASRRSLSFWSRHLTDTVLNERAELIEIRGLAATDLKDALSEMKEDARHTRCINFFYSANFNPAPNERLSEDQWQKAFELFERQRGIPEGQARVTYEHEKNDRVHRHVIWSRIDLNSMKAWPDNFDAKICHAASRAISEELGLAQTPSPFDRDREGPRPARGPKSYEMFRGQKSGIDPRQMKADVTKVFNRSADANEFIVGLRGRGFEIVKGDRRDYCLIDAAGEVHSLARRLSGVNAKQLREFMAGANLKDLSTIAEVKARMVPSIPFGIGAGAGSSRSAVPTKSSMPSLALPETLSAAIEREHARHTRRMTLTAAPPAAEGHSQRENSTLPPTKATPRVASTVLAIPGLSTGCRSFKRQSESIARRSTGLADFRPPTIPRLRIPISRRCNGDRIASQNELFLPRIKRTVDDETLREPLTLAHHPAERSGPMSQAELYEHYKRCGMLEVYFSLFPS